MSEWKNLPQDLRDEGWVAWVLTAAALIGSLAFAVWMARQ